LGDVIKRASGELYNFTAMSLVKGYNKEIAGSEECSPKPIVYKRQKLLSNTTCTPRHDKENNLL